MDETFLRQLTTLHESGLHLLASPSAAADAVEIDDELISRRPDAGAASLRLRDRRYLSHARSRGYGRARFERPRLHHSRKRRADVGERGKLIELLNEMGYDAGRQRIVLNRYTTHARESQGRRTWLASWVATSTTCCRLIGRSSCRPILRPFALRLDILRWTEPRRLLGSIESIPTTAVAASSSMATANGRPRIATDEEPEA